jgi:hypothetical protein
MNIAARVFEARLLAVRVTEDEIIANLVDGRLRVFLCCGLTGRSSFFRATEEDLRDPCPSR